MMTPRRRCASGWHKCTRDSGEQLIADSPRRWARAIVHEQPSRDASVTVSTSYQDAHFPYALINAHKRCVTPTRVQTVFRDSPLVRGAPGALRALHAAALVDGLPNCVRLWIKLS
jgi:hypothetical protein